MSLHYDFLCPVAKFTVRESVIQTQKRGLGENLCKIRNLCLHNYHRMFNVVLVCFSNGGRTAKLRWNFIFMIVLLY